jgi:hypothetical protein
MRKGVAAVAGHGPPPSENKRRRNEDEFADHAITVADDGDVHGPALPDEYGERTAAWYETWRRAPQASAFTGTDWQRLAMLAPIVDAYWAEPSTKLLAEIRLNESLLGATHVDRMRARIKVEAPRPRAPEQPAGVTDMTAARRRRMTDAS